MYENMKVDWNNSETKWSKAEESSKKQCTGDKHNRRHKGHERLPKLPRKDK